jgi:hypothetical protein
MADLKLFINEQISLDGDDRSTLHNVVITDINYLDHRTMLIPADIETSIFEFNAQVSSGTFVKNDLKYARITNHSTVTPINLAVLSSTEEFNFNLRPYQSFYLPSSQITGSLTDFNYDYISSIKLTPSGSDAKVEFFVATN